MDRDCPEIQAKLAMLADGTLPPGEREPLLDQIDQQPELAEDLTHQQDALSLLASFEEIKAPETLHQSIESLLAGTPQVRSSRRLPLRRLRPQLRPVSVGALAACVAAALAIALTTSSSPQPTVMQAADVTLRASTQPPPRESPSRQGELARSVEGIAYPYWQDSLGWRATGARTDRVVGRAVSTVFYASQAGAGSSSKRIGYAIVTGRALALPAGGRVIVDHGIRFELLRSGEATVVTWRRAGHTCILAGRGVSGAQLVHLASWQ